MKKYIVAATVAVMAFAFAAFAAQLTVNDTVLAAGEGNIETCEDVDIDFTNINFFYDGKAGFSHVNVTGFGEDCLGEEVHVALSNDNDVIWVSGTGTVPASGQMSFYVANGHLFDYAFLTDHEGTAGIAVEDVTKAQVLVGGAGPMYDDQF